MELISIYECLCDQTRLRLLNLLNVRPLCVCHFQELLDEPQVKISKHLAYLRKRGLVEAEREGNWMIYRLPKKCSLELDKNLRCLQDCVQENRLFKQDIAKLKRCAKSIEANSPCGC